MWVVIGVVAALMAGCVLVPRLAGATPYTILTSSMEPTMAPGTLVVVRPAEAAEIGIGDVITYQLESGEPAVATHRVIAVTRGPDGEPNFLTQGDGNDSPDPDPVVPEQVRGVAWYQLPHVGRVNQVVDAATRHALTTLLAAGLLGYAAWMFGQPLWERRRRREAPEAPRTLEEVP
jgi:signal peptidase